MTKIKICFISPKAYPLFNTKIKSTFGGAEVQLSLLAKEYSQNNLLNVHFMVSDYGQTKKEVWGNVIVWKTFGKRIFTKIFNFFRIFHIINADVYIQRSVPFSFLIALYCYLWRKKYIFMLSNDGEADGIHFQYIKFFGKMIAKLKFKLAFLVVTQNEYQNSSLQNIKKVNKIFLRSGYSIEKNLNNKKKEILWVGRSSEEKQPEIFLKLAKKFKKESFIMICPPATYSPELSQKLEIKSRKIKNLKFIFFVSFDKINKYFQKAKIFINTSTKEGYPNTFVQAMKNKTPILSLNIDPDNIFSKHNTGICCENKINKMEKNLKKLLQNEKYFKYLSKNAFLYAKKNHNISVNAQKLLQFFK